MKRKIFLLSAFLVVFLCGCSQYDYSEDTINYKLAIGSTFQEKIIFTFGPNAYNVTRDADDTTFIMEDDVLKSDLHAIFSNVNSKYDKKINKGSKKIEAILSYEYLENEFLHSNFITTCFEKYDVSSYENYFEVSLSGKFYCLQDKNLTIDVSSNYGVMDANGVHDGNDYLWEINRSNVDNVNIYYKLSRDYKDTYENVDVDKDDNFWSGIIKVVFILGVILGIGYAIFKQVKKNQNV